MNKVFQILIFIIFFPLPAFPQQGNDISLELATSKLDLEPGKIHTIVYRIRNNSPEAVKLTPGITLPQDWKVISELRHLFLNAGEQQILILSFNIPAKYNAGNYYFIVKLVDPSNYEKIFAEIRSDLTVKEEALLTIELVEAPEFVKAGEQIKASYIVRNTGNTIQTISLTSFNCQIDGSPKIMLAPGSSSVVNVNSETDENLVSPSRNNFYIEAKGENIKSEQIYGFVNVIPVNVEKNDLFHRFPVTVTSRYLAKGREGKYTAGYQFEVAGIGTIDPKGKHKVEFLARGPNQFDLSLLGLYDEYFFSYSNNLFDLKVGDASYSLTPLTEYARYGTGFETNIKVTKFSEVGIMYVAPRFYNNIKAEYGAYGKINFYKKNSLGFYFMKKLIPDEKQDINLYSVTANLQPFERTSIELEASQGSAGKTTDNAYRFNLNSQFSKFSLSTFFFHTGKNYPGYYTNSDFYSGFLNYNPTDWLSVGLSGRQDFMNAELDTLFLTAPFSRQYQGMLSFKLGQRMFFRTYARQYERKDRLEMFEKFHYETRSLNASISHRMKQFGYSIEGEFGKTKNFLLPAGENIKNTSMGTWNLFFQPNPKYYLQGFITYSNINSFISAQENNWIYGLNATGSLTRNLKATLQFQNTYSIEDSYSNRDLFQFSIDYQFLKRHKLSVNSFYTLFQNEINNPDYSFSISYSVNFGIPLKQTAESGAVSGTIENMGVGKIKGIILYAGGQSAITDENGKFNFKNLKPDNYTILIDRTTVDMLDIPDVATPIEITVESNKESMVNFGLTKAAKLTGKIETEKTNETSKLFADEAVVTIGFVILELNRDNESIRIISDGQGRFNFPLVRPGKWFLKVYSNGIDSRYSLEKDYFDYELKPGEVKEVKIMVQKKKRNIIFLNNSVNLSSGEKK